MLACAFNLEVSVPLVAFLGLVQCKTSGNRVYLSTCGCASLLAQLYTFFLYLMVFPVSLFVSAGEAHVL